MFNITFLLKEILSTRGCLVCSSAGVDKAMLMETCSDIANTVSPIMWNIIIWCEDV